ncbi:MAG: hypothetical protein AB7F75_01395 [Planctomycetota bacterium]
MKLLPRLRFALALVLGVATLSAEDWGPDQLDTIREEVASAVVVVKFNADIRFGQQERTRKMETLGTIVAEDGVVLVPNSHVNPGPMEQQGMQITVHSRDFRVMVGEKTYSAKQVYKDAEKDYAFLRITHEEEEGADEDPFKEPSQVEPGDEEPEADEPEADETEEEKPAAPAPEDKTDESGEESEDEDTGSEVKPSSFVHEDHGDIEEPGEEPAVPEEPSAPEEPVKPAFPAEDSDEPAKDKPVAAAKFQFKHVTFAPRPLRMGDKLVAFGRYGEPQKYTPFFMPFQVNGVITSPKLQYGMTFVNSRLVGTPAFDAQGKAVGMILSGTVTTPTGQVVSSGETMLRPVDDLMDIIKGLPAAGAVKDAPKENNGNTDDEEGEDEDSAMEEDEVEPAPEPAPEPEPEPAE